MLPYAPGAPRRSRLILLAAIAVATGLVVPATAHTAGRCVPSPVEPCEQWSVTQDDNGISAPARSDQFTVATLANATTVFLVAKDVAMNPDDPYNATGAALVVAYDRSSGTTRWTVRRSERAYLSPHAASLSPDGSRLFVTGAAYDGYPVGATDSRVSTTALDTATGRELWTSTWDARPDASDNGNEITVSPDGKQVYVAGVTTSAAGDLDFVTLAYDATTGTRKWSATYAGPKQAGSDSPFGIAVDAPADLVVVTGWSDSVTDYDADYATVAYALGHAAVSSGPGHGKGRGHGKHRDPGPAAGQQLWVSRFDGIGAHRSDRAMAVAVDPSGRHVFVTGDSYAGPGGGDYDYGTVAYDARTGTQLWQAAFAGGRGAFNSATQVTATDSVVIVSGQSSAPTADDGNDAGTVGYDVATGQQLWTFAVAPPRQDDFARALQVTPDGGTAFLVTSDTPLVSYTALSLLTLTAVDTATGAIRWQSQQDGGVGNALSGSTVGLTPTADAVVVGGDLKRSVNPIGSSDQNVYDSVVSLFSSS